MKNLTWDELPALFPAFQDADHWLPLLQRHAQLLEDAQPQVKVTSDSPEESIRRHYAESLEVIRLIEAFGDDQQAGLVDIGSGGGFPGLVAAALAPESLVTLIEPLQKRARLLEHIAEAMGLQNVTVLGQRAEEAGQTAIREQASLVTARAVAEMPVLLEYCAPLLRVGGLAALPRGSSVNDDVESAEAACEVLGLEFVGKSTMRPAISEHGTLVMYRKTNATPAKYPRRPGMPKKRPL